MSSHSKKPNPLQIVLFIITISVIAMIWLYRLSPGKEIEIHFELVKMIFQGVIIGVLGLWLKFLFDESVKNREEVKNNIAVKNEREARRRESLIAIFLLLRSLCRVMIKGVESENIKTAENVVNGTVKAPSGEYLEYPDILDQWQIYEPNGLSEKAQYAFIQIQYISGELTNDKRKEIKAKLLKWKDYYGDRIRVLSSGEKTSQVAIDNKFVDTIFD